MIGCGSPTSVAACSQQLDDALARLLDRLARELARTRRGRRSSLDADSGGLPCRRPSQPTIGRVGRSQLAPPRDVGEVAERADHRDAAPLLGVGEVVRLHRHPDAEQRREHLGVEQRLVPLVVGMRDERDARGDQLGPCRLDDDVALAVDPREADRVVRARHLAVLELGLRDRGAEVDVPERGRLGLVRLAPGERRAGTRAATPAARPCPIVV